MIQRLDLKYVLNIADKDERAAALLAYGGQRIDKSAALFGVDSPEYAQAVQRWSTIIRHHLDFVWV